MLEVSPLIAEYKSVCSQRHICPDERLLEALHTKATELHVTSDAHVTILLNLFTTLPTTTTTPLSLPSHLRISAPSLAANTVGTLATYLTCQTHLTHLSIQNTRLPDTAVETLLTALTAVTARHSPLTHVRLSDIGLSTRAACALAPLLSYPLGKLTHLDLSNNSANYRGVAALQAAVASRPASTRRLLLDTSGNLVVIETLNALTHGVGASIALVAGGVLTWQAYRARLGLAGVVSVAIFCVSLFTLLLSSCAYHSLHRHAGLHAMFRRADHCSIFLLIAGSYTPFVVAYALNPPTVSGALTLVGVWTCAIAGIVRSCAGAGSNRSRALFALGTGWMGVISFRTMLDRMQAGAFFGVVGGGVTYSVGMLFYLLGKRHPMLHVVWHLAVMMGGSFHYVALSKYVVNYVANVR